jgi:hypothetical protein
MNLKDLMDLCQLKCPHNEYDFWGIITYHYDKPMWNPDIYIYRLDKDITHIMKKIKISLELGRPPPPEWSKGTSLNSFLRKHSPEGKMVFHIVKEKSTFVKKWYISNRLSNDANLLFDWLTSKIVEGQTPVEFLKSLTIDTKLQCLLAMRHAQSNFQAMESTGMLEQGLIREVATYL